MKKVKKLALNKESLRKLSAADLRAVNGGGVDPSIHQNFCDSVGWTCTGGSLGCHPPI